jgi:hypothetical protein
MPQGAPLAMADNLSVSKFLASDGIRTKMCPNLDSGQVTSVTGRAADHALCDRCDTRCTRRPSRLQCVSLDTVD